MVFLSFWEVHRRHNASWAGRARQTAEIASKCLHLQEFMRQKIKENYSTREASLLEWKSRGLAVVLRIKVVLHVVQGSESDNQDGGCKCQ